MEKSYKIAYKVQPYERLQKVSFHGKLTHPLYIQVTFDRKSIIFKSYYFDLFSKPGYGKNQHGRRYGSTIKDVINTENKLIDFIIAKNIQDFSLDLFKKEYDFYCQDLCDLSEEGFVDYLFTYFNDAGLPTFADAIRKVGKTGSLTDLVKDLETALKPNIYGELIENSFYYAPPYWPLNSFVQHTKKWPLRYFSVMEWCDAKIKSDFASFIAKYFNYVDFPKIERNILNLIS